MKLLLIIPGFFLLMGCEKDAPTTSFTIKGQLLESSSNPIPVSNYDLRIYQYSGIIGSNLKIDATISTDQTGFFNFSYKQRLISISNGTASAESIYMNGFDVPEQPSWSPIQAQTDVTLQPLYLYKKISALVRQIRFNNSLAAGDSLQIISSGTPVNNRKTLYGPIPVGSLITDTLQNVKLYYFDLASASYSLYLTVSKPQFYKDTGFVVNNLDENLRVIELAY